MIDTATNVRTFKRGRPKGARNLLTRAAKEAFELAFEEIGGARALAAWAMENQGEFYKLYARLIPVEQRHSGEGGGPLTIHVTFSQPSGADRL